MVTSSLLSTTKELDISKAVDVITKDELNKNVFNALVQWYQKDRNYRLPEIEMPELLEGLSEEDRNNLIFDRRMKDTFEHPERYTHFGLPKTLKEMGKLVGEHDLQTLERSLESLSSVYMVGISRHRNNIYYSNPAKDPIPCRLKGSEKIIGFYEYLDEILCTIN